MKKFTMEELKGRVHALQRERALQLLSNALACYQDPFDEEVAIVRNPLVERVVKLLDRIDL